MTAESAKTYQVLLLENDDSFRRLGKLAFSRIETELGIKIVTTFVKTIRAATDLVLAEGGEDFFLYFCDFMPSFEKELPKSWNGKDFIEFLESQGISKGRICYSGLDDRVREWAEGEGILVTPKNNLKGGVAEVFRRRYLEIIGKN